VPELRTPGMTLVEASWEDPTGAWYTGTARMEDRSTGGACIRVKTAISVGSRVRIQRRFDQFSGTAKYCRGVGKEYLVGIQRDSTKGADPLLKARTPQEKVHAAALTVETQSLPKPQESGPAAIPMHQRSVESALVLRSAAFAREAPRDRIGFQTNATERADIPQPQQLGKFQQAESEKAEPKDPPPNSKQAGKEKETYGTQMARANTLALQAGRSQPKSGRRGHSNQPSKQRRQH
jgi:hypothetical protein